MLDLEPEHLELIQRLLAVRLPARDVRAFGSRVRGQAKTHSDLDLAVMGEEPIPDLVRAELRADFEESDLPFHVDLLAWRDAPPGLRDVIEREGVEIQAPGRTVGSAHGATTGRAASTGRSSRSARGC